MSEHKKLYLDCLDEIDTTLKFKIAAAITYFLSNIILIIFMYYARDILAVEIILMLFMIFITYDMVRIWEKIRDLIRVKDYLESSFYNWMANRNDDSYFESIRKVRMNVHELH